MTLHRVAVVALAALLAAGGARAEPPVAADSRLVVTRFAAAPDIVHPISLDFDAKGRLLVVESHTHFRPANYAGPKFDRVRVLEDTDGDGKADTFTTFFEGTTATMDLAVHPDGSVYLATRNEVLRLRDTDGDGKADEKTRIAFLETAGNYPHNGLSGLAFDARGDLVFGMGENLGAPYKLIGSDGTTLTGGGEGGNVYRCTADGKKLRRMATGFWNPFGACFDARGRLFVVDNDPDSSPPCRLVQVVEGGDYGFQFRYGRSGRHVFQAWNGELPGTLPYAAGTGESPCEVVAYESDGLPEEYRGNLMVPAWADHRLERYVPRANGASIAADRKPFVQGDKDFHPSGLTVAPDGSLFVSDWGSRSYELHGKGAVWHVKWKDAKPAKRPTTPFQATICRDRVTQQKAARELAKTDPEKLRRLAVCPAARIRAVMIEALIAADDKELDLAKIAGGDEDDGIREMAVRALAARGEKVFPFADPGNPAGVRREAVAGLKGDVGFGRIKTLLTDPDPFLRQAAIHRLGQVPALLKGVDFATVADAKLKASLLLAWKASGDAGRTRVLGAGFGDADPDVRFLAVKWVADEKLAAFRPKIEGMLKAPNLDPRAFLALTTALARIDDKPATEDGLAGYFLGRLADRNAAAAVRLAALKAVPATHSGLKNELLAELLDFADAPVRVEALRALKDRADPKLAAAVLKLARDAEQPVAVRAQAVVTLAAAEFDTNAVIELVGDKEPAVRHEALRALVGAKLTDAQRAKLEAVVKDQSDSAELAARVLGKPFFKDRPAATDIDAWVKRLDGPGDADAGRRVFESTRVATCSRCHRIDGRGANVGPDLSLIGRTDRRWVTESIGQPSAVVAPHFQAWKVETTDGRSRTGLLVHTNLDESTYVDEKGVRFKVLAVDVVQTVAVRASIMPDGLLDLLTDQEARDLVAYLLGRK